MKYLFIDTETTGLPKDENLSPMVTNNWPRLVSFAYILCDERDIVDKGYYIIKPNKFIIPIESTKIHGITTAEAVSKGIVLSEVLDNIRPLIEKCDYIVGHNVVFDINVLNAEFYRYNMTLPVSLKPYLCTMQLAKGYCGLSNTKYPTLEELYTILKGDTISNAHNAQTDAQASMECFWILKDSGFVDCKTEKPTIKIYPTEDNISWAGKHVSKDYASKSYALLAIASNLLNNHDNLFKYKSNIDSFAEPGSINYILQHAEDDIDYVNSFYERLYPDYVTVIIPNNKDEWMNVLFEFFENDLKKTFTSVVFNKYDGSPKVIARNMLSNKFKAFEKEVGGIELIEKYEFKNPESTHQTLILEDESSWVDIAIEAVKARIQSTNSIGNELLSLQDTEGHFISMIEYLNEIRETERNKRIDKWNTELEKSLNPKSVKETEEIIKNYSSPYTTSSSGCMLILSLFIGISSSLCCLIAVLLL